MINLILFRFWPALLPLLIYTIWHRHAVRRAKKAGIAAPHFRSGKLYWTVIVSLVVAMLCFVVMGADIEAQKGRYVPPSMENGVIVPGHIEP